MRRSTIERIISGGQTGVDRAALDFAIDAGIPAGGWCPRGRKAEDGIIDKRYRLTETRTDEYAERTRKNVESADGTLVITRGRPRGGTAYTIKVARELKRPLLRLDLGRGTESVELIFMDWIAENRIRTLNVAGPRESSAPGIGLEAMALLRRIFGAKV